MQSIYSHIESLIQDLDSIVTDYSSATILVDSNTLQMCWPKIASCPALSEAAILEVNPGEENKNLEICHQLWISLMDNGADRNAILINLGGGMICDMGGFVASTFKRGIDFIHIPTTLLSMVDAANGGKTGINLFDSKNQIGTFAHAIKVFICAEFLYTLPKRELISGFAEMLKHGLISDEGYWEKLVSVDDFSPSNLSPLIEKSIEIKKSIVSQDPSEKGIRKVLNFGHTVGHAIESVSLGSEKHLLHGEAVGLGMMIETELSFLKGLLDLEVKNRIIQELQKIYSPYVIEHLNVDDLWTEMLNDKKNHKGSVRIVGLKNISEPIIDVEIIVEELRKAFKTLF